MHEPATLPLRVQAQNINKSLSALGNTMGALAQGKGRHVPYRDSKLTFLLQECFTGDGKSLLVCALAPETNCLSESVSSLRFAQTVSQVTMKSAGGGSKQHRCAVCGDRAVAAATSSSSSSSSSATSSASCNDSQQQQQERIKSGGGGQHMTSSRRRASSFTSQSSRGF